LLRTSNADLDWREITPLHHPLALGVPEEIEVWVERSPAWETGEAAPVRYPEANLLASGWLLGEKRLAGKAALVDGRLGGDT
jgi:hypothetical protein